nr:MAG TPA: hypothetical protein [Caudoviricetes sp.]
MTFSVTFRICKENDNTSYALDRGISLYLGALYELGLFTKSNQCLRQEHHP